MSQQATKSDPTPELLAVRDAWLQRAFCSKEKPSGQDARVLLTVFRAALKHGNSRRGARKPRQPRAGSVREALEKIPGWRDIPNLTLARRLQKLPSFKTSSLDNLRRQIVRLKKSDSKP